MTDLIFESQQELDERVNNSTLAKLSGIADPNKIYPGQKITLPGGGSYTVKSGDTLSGIAQNYRLANVAKPKLDDPTTKIPQIPAKPKLDDPTTKIPQTPKKKMAKLDDPTTKLPQVAEEEATVNIPVQELADIMQLAGYANYAERIEEYANEPDEQYMDAEEQLVGLSGGLNGPKSMHTPAAGGDNPMDKEALKTVEENLYKSYKDFLEEAEIKEED